LRFYQDEQLSVTVQDGRETQLLYHFNQPLGQQVASDHSQTLLLQTDANHSVIAESQQNTLRNAVYSAYGERHSDSTLLSLRAFNGEVREASGWYLLGRGYRAYNPVQMRFHSPDSFSPFGSGGVNPYMYCLGNPIALRDPTGHTPFGYQGRPRRPDEDAVTGREDGGAGVGSWISVAVGAIFVVVGVAATVATFGAATPLTAPLIAKGTLLAVGTALSAGSTVASAVAAANNDEEAARWGMYLGFAALAAAAPSILHGAYKGIGGLVGKLMKSVDDVPIPTPPPPTHTPPPAPPGEGGSLPGVGTTAFFRREFGKPALFAADQATTNFAPPTPPPLPTQAMPTATTSASNATRSGGQAANPRAVAPTQDELIRELKLTQQFLNNSDSAKKNIGNAVTRAKSGLRLSSNNEKIRT